GVARRGTRRRPRGRGRRLRRPRRHDPDCGLRAAVLAQPTRRCGRAPSSLRPLLWVVEPGGISADTDTELLAAKGLTANIPAAQEVRRRPSAAVAASGRLRGPRLLG